MKQLKLTAFFICLILMGLVINANSQTVRKDANGNYVPVQTVRDSVGAKKTGSVYTDNRKINWEAEYEGGNFCIGENIIENFIS